MRFAGKVALITAVASGIGRATADIMAKEGATIVGVDNNAERLEKTVAEITAAGGKAYARLCNALDKDEVDPLVESIAKEFNGIDILVNAVGGSTIIPRSGATVNERGRRMDEGIAMMKAVWSQDPVSFDAKVIPSEIKDMTMLPQPISPIPMWHGSRSKAAHRRTVRIGDGWHGSQVTPEQAGEVVKRLRRDRPEPSFTISVRSHWDGKDAGMMKERVAAYEAAGVQHVMVHPQDREIDDWDTVIAGVGKLI